MAGIILKSKGFAALPSVAGPESMTETATAYNSGFAASVAVGSLRQTLAQSLRLLAQSSCLRSGFANPQDVMRT